MSNTSLKDKSRTFLFKAWPVSKLLLFIVVIDMIYTRHNNTLDVLVMILVVLYILTRPLAIRRIQRKAQKLKEEEKEKGKKKKAKKSRSGHVNGALLLLMLIEVFVRSEGGYRQFLVALLVLHAVWSFFLRHVVRFFRAAGRKMKEVFGSR